MLTVHHLGISQSERIVWLCEELGIPYELKRYERDSQTRLAPAAYKALHPMGISPVITDGDVVLAESGAIVSYVIARHGQGRLTVAPDAPNFADYLFWLHFSNGTLMPAAFGQMTAGGAPNPMADLMRQRTDRGYAMLEVRLRTHPYLAGDDFTAADIMMGFVLTTMRAFTGASLADHPGIRAYLARIGERPAYQRAMAKGDPGFTPLLG